jgi:polysaccharide deacetylase 2 family uncharacterized protein YibQ
VKSEDGTKPRGTWRLVAALGAVACALVVLVAALLVPQPVAVPPPPAPVAAAAPAPAAEDVLVAAPLIAVSAEPLAPPPQPEPPAWRRFAAAAPPPDGKPRIAVVIDDLGLDAARTARAMALPPAVTLSFMAYAKEARTEAADARARGHELLIHVPMEPRNPHEDMGPNGLAAALGPDEVMRRLRLDLSSIDAYVGINNHMGSRFTADAAAMAPVIDELKARGLLFLDSRTTGDSRGALLAQRAGVPFAERDVFLDDEPTAPAIAAQLKELEAWARRHGTAIAIGHPRDETSAALEAWIGTLPDKGLVLVPLSAVVAARSGALLHADGVAVRDLAPAR